MNITLGENGLPQSATFWLVVGNGANWGKGHTLKEAFVNAMHHDSHTYPTTKLFIRKIMVDLGNAALIPSEAYALIEVDGMGNGQYPKGATVQKMDVGKGEPLAAETAALLASLRRFNACFEDLTCTEVMDEAFGGDAVE